ncbi:MAG: 50S ribosomal protein L15 [ANME-2 cluster archaeon]|nr:50S ribosomal protein L15 [ANME-2 cluster archaeon]MCL7474579.1 50S ribosomal protein L15 [ANME-2 cluster archaeon]
MKKNVSKFRGSRTCGGGTSKNRRGGGSRGGRGNAGGCKHHFVRNYLNGLAYGKHGFKRPQKMLIYTPIVNVGELDELAEQLVLDGQAQKEGDMYHINLAELDIDKVLGGGMVTKSIVLTVSQCSERARSKLEEAGGSVVEYISSKMEQLPEPKEPLELADE